MIHSSNYVVSDFMVLNMRVSLMAQEGLFCWASSISSFAWGRQ